MAEPTANLNGIIGEIQLFGKRWCAFFFLLFTVWTQRTMDRYICYLETAGLSPLSKEHMFSWFYRYLFRNKSIQSATSCLDVWLRIEDECLCGLNSNSRTRGGYKKIKMYIEHSGKSAGTVWPYRLLSQRILSTYSSSASLRPKCGKIPLFLLF